MIATLIQSAAIIGGVVMGPGGAPISGAMVVTGDQQVLTDAKGGFSLKVEGPAILHVSAKGFSPQEREAKPGETLLVLLEREAQGATVEVVEGSGYSSEGPSSSISRLEIYMTPGAAADVFQATKALPGVSNASEGAELFVRGGKPEEVGIYLNGGRLPRPYHHPNTQGGIFFLRGHCHGHSLGLHPRWVFRKVRGRPLSGAGPQHRGELPRAHRQCPHQPCRPGNPTG